MDRSSLGPKTLFPKGPSFTLDSFSSKDFIVRDFVDSLAESAVPSVRRSGTTQAAFDPKPLIRTFEGASTAPRPSGVFNHRSNTSIQGKSRC